MGIEILIPLFGIFSVLLVPILGVTVILTTRFALKPLAETLATAFRESGHSSPPEALQHLGEVTEQVQALTEEVHRLREAQEFDQRLLERKGGAGSPPSESTLNPTDPAPDSLGG